MITASVRAILLAGVLVVTAAACSDPDASPSTTTRAATSTTYATIPARTTTSTVPRASADDPSGDGESDDTIQEDPNRERIYEIRSGDYLVRIAATFDVPVENIVAYNEWTDGLGHALVPGEEIRIPPANYDPDGSASTDVTEPGADDSRSGQASVVSTSTDACPDGEPRETYTIKAGDIPARVAADLDTTVAELDAANVATAGYSGFVVGIEINVPC